MFVNNQHHDTSKQLTSTGTWCIVWIENIKLCYFFKYDLKNLKKNLAENMNIDIKFKKKKIW